jgi:5-(carboxyamino)imidazole ribonucleotide synthase
MVKNNQPITKDKVGILGGGQLARMLILRGYQLGLQMSILSQSSDDPAARVCRDWVQGNPKDLATVKRFLKSIDILTFESEFIDDQVIRFLKKSSKVSPSAKAMEMFQDRSTQKTSLVNAMLPTASFIIPSAKLDELSTHFSRGYVIKSRKFGYDGHGTWVIKNKNSELPLNISTSPQDYIAEEFVPFKRELALTFVCSTSGDIISLPLVETKQHQQRCLWVKGPVSHKLHSQLERKLKKYLKNINYVGAITFELFDTGDQLIINEVAPRVHNSAHYSWDALSEDQFILHLKAIIGAKITRPQLISKGFAMYNLIGSHHKTPSWQLPSEARFHWYGKIQNRPGRKMGHLNATGNTSSQALLKLKKAKKDFDI